MKPFKPIDWIIAGLAIAAFLLIAHALDFNDAKAAQATADRVKEMPYIAESVNWQYPMDALVMMKETKGRKDGHR
jgi:hypothetical protein